MFDQAAARIPLLARLSPADRDRLRPHASLRRIDRRQSVWRESEPAGELLFLLHGRAKLSRATESGREVILDTCGEGELLCGSAACAGRAYCCSATTLHEPIDVLAVTRSAALEVIDRSPSAARAFLQEASRREMALTRRIEELSSGHVERRVATLLLRLAEQIGVPGEGGSIAIPVAFSRQDLADLCGTTLETAIRTMTRLGREGLVRSVEKGFVIRDREGLTGVARGRD
jgi:CRP-like cAMP-binding protein